MVQVQALYRTRTVVMTQASASLCKRDSFDEDQPGPWVNARLVSHKEEQHRGSSDLVTFILN